MYHTEEKDWFFTPRGECRGYIQPESLKELWFHTGTMCNLDCSFCFEGSKPGDFRLEPISLEEIRPFIKQGLDLGVEQFSFTGGEPFMQKDFVDILDYALDFRPALVLTNGTDPLIKQMARLVPLKDKPHEVRFRISIDSPSAEEHDAVRGQGNFEKSLKSLSELHRNGFGVSVARREIPGENTDEVNLRYADLFREYGVPEDTRIVVFPDLLPPGSTRDVPDITEHCMTTYKDQYSRSMFMCAYSKMVIKRDGIMKVTACTLVDDTREYDLADTLNEAMQQRVMLKHHRCFSCFSSGASCSEL